ncbi:hypothetical protein HNR23_003939 [Nocardiopsis mwathae]|uniref:Integral membrane protein n=1 Tax=Nocardiopsis mwathae TaxID=1472723 RepID=A0A7W9YKV6_9ACTN|nr:hypothetical protein [Nocardiopsis mwathae]MBB6173879.1 hypothetical protein [Nocardiopsis mwathae]
MPDERAVELRIHGVSGGEAEELLDVEPAMRVSGDGLAGFFRWRRKPDTEMEDGVPREIFAWGNLTSGRASRALWLLLLPFTLVNMAYWMRPGRPDDRPGLLCRLADAGYGLSVRLLALSLTVLLTLGAAGVGMDLVAWQCSGYGERCAELRPLLGFLSAPEAPMAEPGRALAIGALLPLAVVALLWRLSRRTESVYEVVEPPYKPVHRRVAPLSDPEFWQNSLTMGRLRSAHVAAAVAAVTTLLLAPALGYDRVGGTTAAVTVGTVLSVLLAATFSLSSLCVLIPGTDPRWNGFADRFCRVLRDIALALLAATLVYVLLPRPGWAAEGRLPGFGIGLNMLFVAQCALGVLLLVCAVVLYRARPAHTDIAMRGVAGPTAAALGTLLGGVFTAAVVFQAAGLLGGCYYPGAEETGCIPLRAPGAFAWLQLAFTMEAVIALAAGAVLWRVMRARTRRETDVVAALYQRDPALRRTRHLAAARTLGGATETLAAVIAAFLLPVAALILLVGYSMLTGRLSVGPDTAGDPAMAVSGATGWIQVTVTAMVTVGSWLGGLLLVALVVVGGSAYRDQPTRQVVGVLWDIGTFWPRAAHPLAPPSYAERAVPQLVARVAGKTARGIGVVLSGHSQGSVLAAATAWQLPARCRPHVVLLTHGSPLYRLYARYFPAYFGPRALGDLDGRVEHWRNLWRATDPIGGPIEVERDGEPRSVGFAEPIPDPRHYDPREGEALPPPVLGHSFYTRDPAYAEAALAAVRRVARHPAVERLPRPVGPVVAADPTHRRADVEQEDQ